MGRERRHYGEESGEEGCGQGRIPGQHDREEAEDLLHRWRHPPLWRPHPLRQVAQVRADPALAPDLVPAYQGAASNQPVQEHLRQAPGGPALRLLNQLKPESKSQKAERIGEAAEAKAAGKSVDSKKPVCVKMGINHVTKLV